MRRIRIGAAAVPGYLKKQRIANDSGCSKVSFSRTHPQLALYLPPR